MWMRRGWILAAAGLLAACGERVEEPVEPDVTVVEAPDPIETPAEIAKSDGETDYQAVSGYGEGWYVSPGWPGEYPAGFAVLDPGVVVNGWSQPNSGVPADLECPLPQYANYQLWNRDRVEKDDLDFFVATKTFPVTLSQDASIEYVSDTGIKTLDLKTGDQLTYLRYLGEGFTIVSFGGEEYDINEAELREISDISSLPAPTEDQWVNVECEDGSRAWLLYSTMVDLPGVVASPIMGYGEASDIAPDDVAEVRAGAAAMANAYEGIEPEAALPDQE
ncbi:hypothetical protein HY3_03005 [Hyphomonas pacifica]|uniref:Lipoprotein n=2 Tax=Hyphomonas pacifica TaxID=1280941 RepID=A0A8B2PM83_9PROT|nr:hypothetical protein HY3_03005 [Hyphomonas pacifica]